MPDSKLVVPVEMIRRRHQTLLMEADRLYAAGRYGDCYMTRRKASVLDILINDYARPAVTDEMVERACRSHYVHTVSYGAKDNPIPYDEISEFERKNVRDEVLNVLDAALEGEKCEAPE